MTLSDAVLHPRVPWLDGEQFDAAIDAAAGAVDEPPAGGDALTLTNVRILKTSSSAGQRSVTLIPLSSVDAVEIVEVSRPNNRLGQGLAFLAVGAVFGYIAWYLVGIPFVSLLAGGIPTLIGVYALAGWAFPDSEGALRIYARSHTITQPLRSGNAKRDAFLIAQRLSELLHAPAEAPPPPADDDDARPEPAPPDDAPPPARPRPHFPVRRRPWAPLRQRHNLPRLPARSTPPAPASPRRKATGGRFSRPRPSGKLARGSNNASFGGRWRR